MLIFFLLENHKVNFKLNSIIHGFANKVRQSYRVESNFVENQIAPTGDVCNARNITY